VLLARGSAFLLNHDREGVAQAAVVSS